MWVKQCHKPPMTGNGFNPTDKNGDDWGLVYYCFTHIRWDDLLWEYHQIIPRVYDPWHDLGVPWLPHWSLPFLGYGWMGYPCVPKQRKLNGSKTGWWFQPLWKILVSWVSWDDDIPSRWKVKFHSCSKAPASFSTNQLIEPPKTPSFFRSHVEPRLSPSLWYPKSFWNFWTGHVLC